MIRVPSQRQTMLDLIQPTPVKGFFFWDYLVGDVTSYKLRPCAMYVYIYIYLCVWMVQIPTEKKNQKGQQRMREIAGRDVDAS